MQRFFSPRLTASMALGVCVLVCQPLAAKDADPGFLPRAAQANPAQFLPPPPPEGSTRALEELAELKAIIASATPQQMALAKSDNDNENGTIFAVALGPKWDLTKLPATDKLIREVTASEGGFSDIAKEAFHRKRPWQVDASIKTCAPYKATQENGAYPSGHTTVGYGMGIVLANVMPEHAGEILARSAQFAENRLVCGFHRRADIVAGQQYATLFATRLMAHPQFQADMAAAKAELKAAGFTQ